jgi:LacI family transcriptional regulator
MGKVTVFEVAAAAGVSLATVDRVLNRRKGVRPATVERVQSTIEKLGFRRDMFAAGLATRRRERYLFILPARGTNSFINILHGTVADAGAGLADQRVSVQVVDYIALDDLSLSQTLAALDAEAWDGIAIVAVEAPPVRHEIDRLAARGVPIVTLVSDVSPSRRSHFLGIDNKAAGRVAASMIGRMVQSTHGTIGVFVGQMTLHDHADRRLGFEQVMKREFPALTLLPTVEARDDAAFAERLAARLLQAHPDLVGLYSAGAGNRGIIAALRALRRDRAAPIVVAHELTAHTRDALLSETFTAVLHQDQEQEVENAIAALRAMARSDKDFSPRPVRIQIFLRDNVP